MFKDTGSISVMRYKSSSFILAQFLIMALAHAEATPPVKNSEAVAAENLNGTPKVTPKKDDQNQKRDFSKVDLFLDSFSDTYFRVDKGAPSKFEDTIDTSNIDVIVLGARSRNFKALLHGQRLDPQKVRTFGFELSYRIAAPALFFKDLGAARFEDSANREAELARIRTQPDVEREVDRQLRLAFPDFDNLPEDEQNAWRQFALQAGYKIQDDMIAAETARQKQIVMNRLDDLEIETAFYNDFKASFVFGIGQNKDGKQVRVGFVEIGRYRPDNGAPRDDLYRTPEDQWFIVPNRVANAGGVGHTGAVTAGYAQNLKNNRGRIQISATAFANRPPYFVGLTEYAGGVMVLDEKQYKAYENWHQLNSSLLRVLYSKGNSYAYVSAGHLGGEISLNPLEVVAPGAEQPDRGSRDRFVTSAGFLIPLGKRLTWGLDLYYGNRREIKAAASTSLSYKWFEKYLDWADAKVLVVTSARFAHVQDGQRVDWSVYERESWQELSLATQARIEKEFKSGNKSITGVGFQETINFNDRIAQRMGSEYQSYVGLRTEFKIKNWAFWKTR